MAPTFLQRIWWFMSPFPGHSFGSPKRSRPTSEAKHKVWLPPHSKTTSPKAELWSTHEVSNASGYSEGAQSVHVLKHHTVEWDSNDCPVLAARPFFVNRKWGAACSVTSSHTTATMVKPAQIIRTNIATQKRGTLSPRPVVLAKISNDQMGVGACNPILNKRHIPTLWGSRVLQNPRNFIAVQKADNCSARLETSISPFDSWTFLVCQQMNRQTPRTLCRSDDFDAASRDGKGIAWRSKHNCQNLTSFYLLLQNA